MNDRIFDEVTIDRVIRRESHVASRLALEGGTPIVPSGQMMYSRWPRVKQGDLDAIIDVIRAGHLTEMSGRQQMHVFETDIALYHGVRYCLSTNSGTAALHCGLHGLGVGPGDEVVVPALSYIACASAVLHQRATPVFADVDASTYTMTRETVEAALTPQTRGIMVVHLHGLPAPLDEILALARERQLWVLEDFSQAVGASFQGQRVGSLGDAGAASLMAGKNLPSLGEAGMLVTSDRLVRNRAAELKCFGETIDAAGARHLLHRSYGYNYRANIVGLVLATRQLFHLDEFNDLRRKGAAKLDAVLAELPGFDGPVEPPGRRHVYHMYRFSFDPERMNVSATRNQVREALRQIFAAEGLPLVEFQNRLLHEHPVVDEALERKPVASSFPGARRAIEGSLVVGLPAQAPLANPSLVDHYARAFEKLGANLGALGRIAASCPDRAPWAEEARIF